MKRLEFPDNLIRLDFTVYMPSSDQCLPEDSGEDVRKDGDDDEHHEGQDDQGGQAAADVLPTSTGKIILKTSSGFKIQSLHLDLVLWSSTWWDRSDICRLSSSQSEDIPVSAPSTHFVLHDGARICFPL